MNASNRVNTSNPNNNKPSQPMNLPLLPDPRRLLPLLLLCLALPTVPGQTAPPPNAMSFQGYLTDQLGSPLGATNTGPKNYTVVFRIWDAATGGNEQHAEQQTVTVNNGYFSTLLGQGSPYLTEPFLGANLARVFIGSTAASRYMEMMVVAIGAAGANVTLAPRLQLVSSPYAYLAANAVTAGSLANTNGTVAMSLSPSTGYVGVNTTTPNTWFEVGGNASFDNLLMVDPYSVCNYAPGGNFANALVFGGWNTGEGIYCNRAGSTVVNGAGNKNGLTFATSSQPRMVIQNQGWVGIGTNTPGCNLDVAGNGNYNGSLTVNSGLNVNNTIVMGSTAKQDYKGLIEAYYSGANDRYGLGLIGGATTLYASSIYNQSSIQFGLMTGANTISPMMKILHNGYVGINTTSPSQLLEVNGNALVDANLTVSGIVYGNVSGIVNGTVNGNVNGTIVVDPNSSCVGQMSLPSANAILFGGSGSGEGIFSNRQFGDQNALGLTFTTYFQPRMAIANNGNVGIGTTSPGYPLEVSGYAMKFFDGNSGITQWNMTRNNGNNGYFQLGNPDFYSANGSYGGGDLWAKVPIGILVNNGAVAAHAFVATSDGRIKDIVARPAASKLLEQARQLRVTDYRMKDWVQNGNGLHRGVIAQEVQKVLPGSVTLNTNFVPDIYAYALGLSNNAAAGTLTINLAKAHPLAVNDWVRIILEHTVLDCQVVGIPDQNSFTLKTDKAGTRAFVFGRRVNDFMNVDYNQLFATGLGAIQELADKADAEAAKVEQLSKRVEELAGQKKAVAALERKAAQVDDLTRQVAELKQLVAQLAAANAAKTTARTGPEPATTVAVAIR